MAKVDYGTCVGKCEVCTINLWSSAGSKPVVWPCNIEGCPYERAEDQNKRSSDLLTSFTGSWLAQIEF
jgi:hypothetical protein